MVGVGGRNRRSIPKIELGPAPALVDYGSAAGDFRRLGRDRDADWRVVAAGGSVGFEGRVPGRFDLLFQDLF